MYYAEICNFLGVINYFPLFTENLLAARNLPVNNLKSAF